MTLKININYSNAANEAIINTCISVGWMNFRCGVNASLPNLTIGINYLPITFNSEFAIV